MDGIFWWQLYIPYLAKRSQVLNIQLFSPPSLVWCLIVKHGGWAVIYEICGVFDCIWPETLRHIRTEQLAHSSLQDILDAPFSQTILFMLIWGTHLMDDTLRCKLLFKFLTAELLSSIRFEVLEFEVGLVFNLQLPPLKA
jgi:hypothetical protein